MPISTIPSVRTPMGRPQDAVQVVQYNWGAGVVLTLASPGSKSAVLFAQTDGMAELCSDTNCWYTVSGQSAVGTSGGASVAAPGSALLPANTPRWVYVQQNSIIGAIAIGAGSGNLGIIPALMTT